MREYDPVVGRWTSKDPAGQYHSPYVAMGNNPVSGTDPDGGWVKGAGFWNNLFHSDSRIKAEQYAASWSSDYTDYSATKIGGEWGVLAEDKMRISTGHWEALQFRTFTTVNGDGSLGETSSLSSFVYAGPALGTINPDYTIESFIVGGALFKGGVQGISWAGQRLLFGTSNRVFWSGGLAGSAGEAAASYAGANGAITLEMTFAGRALTGLTNMTSYSFTRPLWNLASRGFANGARGTANVFINPTRLSSSSIWLNAERGILRANGVQYQYHIIPH